MPNRSHTFRTILVAYDSSPQSQRAADTAFAMAKQMHSKVQILSVIRPPEPAARAELNAVLDDAREHYAESFAALKAQAAEAQVKLTTDIAIGHPAEQIVHRAEELEADLIVMGRRGVSAFQRWMLGSISERVLRYAHCPVMVVH